MYYINSKIIPQGLDISDFIEKRESSTFKSKGGNRGTSDISNVLKSVLTETKENEIAILVIGICPCGSNKNNFGEYKLTSSKAKGDVWIKSTFPALFKNNESIDSSIISIRVS